MADKGKRRKGKLRADKRGFSPSQYATITFQGRQVGESLRYTRRTGSCFCYAKPLGRYASPRLWLLSSKKVTPAQRKKRVCAYTRARILRLVSLAQNDKAITCLVFQRADVGIRPFTLSQQKSFQHFVENLLRQIQRTISIE